MQYIKEFNIKSFVNLKNKLSNNHTILFGASNLGRRILPSLKENNINIDYLCDNDKKKCGEVIDGIEIISVEKLSKLSLETNIIIASMYYDEISTQLIRLGFKNIVYYYDRVVWDENEEEQKLIDFISVDEVNKEIEKSKKFKNSKRGKRSFLLATGPSIKLENLKQLEGEDSYSISNFFLHKDIEIINPKMHFFAPYHMPLIFPNYIEWLLKADKSLPKETEICLEISTKRFIDDFQIFKNRRVYYVKFNEKSLNEEIDLDKGLIPPVTGPLMIVPLLIYMGYSRIYLLGCDCNSIKNYGEHVLNFYSEKEESRINATNSKGWIGIVDYLNYQIKMHLQYQLYDELAHKKESIIINLSQDSWLECFKKDKLDNIKNL